MRRKPAIVNLYEEREEKWMGKVMGNLTDIWLVTDIYKKNWMVSGFVLCYLAWILGFYEPIGANRSMLALVSYFFAKILINFVQIYFFTGPISFRAIMGSGELTGMLVLKQPTGRRQ